MSTLDFAALSKDAKGQLALSLAAFILHDSKIPVNADNLNKTLKAAHAESCDATIKVYAHALEATPVDKFLSCGSGAGAAGKSDAPAAKEAKPAKEEKKVEAKKEPEPEPDVDMDMGDLFG